MSDALRPLVIMALVLTEVGLWQWRVLLTATGSKGFPTVLGIVGAILQVTAIAQVVTNLRDPLTVGAYALGVGGGVLIGVVVGTRFSAEAVGVTVVSREPALDAQLRSRGWPVVSYHGHGDDGEVRMLQIVVPGRRRAAVLDDVDDLAPQAFWTTGNLQLTRRALGTGQGAPPSRQRPAARGPQ